MATPTVGVSPAPDIKDKGRLQAYRENVRKAQDAIAEQARLMNKLNAEYQAAKQKKKELEDAYRKANLELVTFAKGAN